MKIFVFGSSLTSTYWNGAATYYRGIYKNLHRLGYKITFAEPAIYGRQEHQDEPNIPYANVILYQSPEEIPRLLREASHADVVIKHSGVGAEDGRLEREVLRCLSNQTKVLFWDVDAPATLARVEADVTDPFRTLISEYDAIFTYGGGASVISKYRRHGAKACIPIYNGLDPETHHPVVADPQFSCDLAFVGHRLPDRESRVQEFFLNAAEMAPEMSFVIGGEGWGSRALPKNVRWIGHVSSDRHNVVNCSARMVLNVNRDSMAQVGFSPPTRVFEAAGAGACVITDKWDGVDHFFNPGTEILPAGSGEEVVGLLRSCDKRQATKVGAAMLCRSLMQHTYEMRAREIDSAFKQLFSKRRKQHRPNNSIATFIASHLPIKGAVV